MYLLYICTVLVLFNETEGCEDVNTLPYMDLRARNNPFKGTSGTEHIVSDDYTNNGWYTGIHNGVQYLIPDSTTMPASQTCGTNSPYYIKGIHPSTKEMKIGNFTNITVCARTLMDSCSFDKNLTVMKCEDGIRYYLIPTPSDSAYCFDPPEIRNVSGFSEPPANVNTGHVLIKPGLKFEKHTDDQQEAYTKPTITFQCVFEDEGYFYTSYWYINNEEFLRIGPSQTQTHILTEDTLIAKGIKMGFNIKCGIRVSADKTGQKTQLESSDSFFAGIQAKEPVIYISKTEDAIVRLSATVPIGAAYRDPSTVDSTATLRMISPDKSPLYTERCNKFAVLSYNHRCGKDFTAYTEVTIENWNSDDVYEFGITRSTTDVNGENYFQFKLQFEMEIPHEIWRGYTTDVIQIIVTDGSKRYTTPCFSNVDPHHRTFDGYSYEQQEPGTYLLYGNLEFGIEVHEMLGACLNGRAQCACGVYVRAGADAFTINLCHEKPFIDYLPCGDDSRTLLVYEMGTDYKIYTPIGSWVDINIDPSQGYEGFMNIAVYSSPNDFKKTQGLCGFFDGEKNNDIRYSDDTEDQLQINIWQFYRHHKDFANSWKLNEENSLFGQTYGSNLQKWGTYTFEQCICNRTNEGNLVDECSPIVMHDKGCYVFNNATEYNKCAVNKIRKRNINDDRRKREYGRIITTNRNSYPRNKRQRRQEMQEISEEEAFDYCSGLINASAAVDSGLFDGYLELDSQSIAEMCTFDVMTGNDFALANVHVDVANKLTKSIIEHDSEFVNNSKIVVTEFLKSSCPKNCSGNGVCSENGTCICFEFYHNIDCRIDEREQLSVLGLEGGGLCTVSDKEDCRCFYTYTTNLLKTLSCRLSGYMVYHDNTFEHISEVTRPGEYKDVFTGDCCLGVETRRRRQTAKNPFYLHYRISISNDGNTFSDDKDMYVYSSQCQEAIPFSGDAYNIVLKNGYCYIDGVCISENQTHPTDECLRCSVSGDVNKWTRDCPITQQETRFNGWRVAVIIVSILLSMAVIGGVVVAVVIKRQKQMSRGRVSDATNQNITRSATALFHNNTTFVSTNQDFVRSSNTSIPSVSASGVGDIEIPPKGSEKS